MKRNSWMILTTIALVVGVAFAIGFWVRASGKSQSTEKDHVKMKTLTIKWQRLVGDTGQTCDRCGTTRKEVREAHALLRKSLSPLGIDVVLEEKALDKAAAAKNIAESNRIWIAGKPLETWLSAKPGTSDCSSCASLCGSLIGGDVACRTIIVDQSTYESIPSKLIVKAGLLAAAEMVGGEPAQPRYGGWNSSGVKTIRGGAGGCGQ